MKRIHRSRFQVLHLLRPVFERYNVVGFDIVELCPSPTRQAHASQYLAARLAYQLMTYKEALSR